MSDRYSAEVWEWEPLPYGWVVVTSTWNRLDKKRLVRCEVSMITKSRWYNRL